MAAQAQSVNQQELQRLWPYLSVQEQEHFLTLLQPRLLTKFVPHSPNARQIKFLDINCQEAFYGGAAGGGKSDALIMAAAQYVDVPGYAALLLRKSYSDLALAGALMDRAKDWFTGTGAHWTDKTKTWAFPGGGSISFGYLENEDDKYRYKSAEFQFIGFDELTQFTETQYQYLFSRLRKPQYGPLADIPLRMRSASNPGDKGHAWVKERFIPKEFFEADEKTRFAREWQVEDRWFVPARKEDNVALNQAEYDTALNKLDPVTREQLKRGDWAVFDGGRFNKDWFRHYRVSGDRFYLDTLAGEVWIPQSQCWRLVTVDPAASQRNASDYTAIGVFAVTPERHKLVLHMTRERLAIEEIPQKLYDICQYYRPVWVGFESVGFQIGVIKTCRAHGGIGTIRELFPAGKGKLVRATPAIIACEQGELFLPQRAPWLDDFTQELTQFTGDEKKDAHDDQVDVLAYAVQEIDRATIFQAPSRTVTVEKLPPRESRPSAADRRGLFGRVFGGKRDRSGYISRRMFG